MMNNPTWSDIKSQYPLGQFVQGTVEFHTPFGIFVQIEPNLTIKGLIKIPDFLDEGTMTPALYPPIGAKIGAIVVGYNDSNQVEIYLSAKPSILHKALVPLKMPATIAAQT